MSENHGKLGIYNKVKTKSNYCGASSMHTGKPKHTTTESYIIVIMKPLCRIVDVTGTLIEDSC